MVVELLKIIEIKVLAPKVPTVVGMDIEEATNLLLFLEFTVRRQVLFSDVYNDNKVVLQTILPGSNVRPGSLIVLMYSS